MPSVTPLDAWIRAKAGIDSQAGVSNFAEDLQAFQLGRLNDVITYVRRNAPFYRRHLSSLPDAPLSALSDIARLPFTTAEDLSRDPTGFVAVGQDDIARIVTLRTSGSTGESKRLFFTEDDLELTVDFFHHGMSNLVRPGQKVAVLLPGELPDSVGDLLVRGLRRMNVPAHAFGPVKDALETARNIASFGADCIVGIPTQVLAVARSPVGAAFGKGRIDSVLLSTDYVPAAIARRLEDSWGCRVFNHYGMTEMGLGGGVECKALAGYHLREADLYVEVVDHETGAPRPDGRLGEVVFTTITRRGMPLIRYRTGDIARFLPVPCPCGSVLRRMERVRGRWCGTVHLGAGSNLTLADMDESLFRLTKLLDYKVLIARGEDGRFRMRVDVHGTAGGGPTESEVVKMLMEVDAVRMGIAKAYLEIPEVRFSTDGHWSTTGVSKRRILTSHDLIDGH